MNYKDKAADYYSNVRHDLINLVSKDSKGLKVLEIGAAYGETLHFLQQSGIASETVGIDIFEDKERHQNYKPLNRFIFGNIEEMDFPEYKNYFDLILLPDVLEHLIEPKKTLAKALMYLKDDGQLLVSMPNIRHYYALKKIYLQGNFEYEESGLFDYTHMRFYCRKDMISLLHNSGFEVRYTESSIRNYKGKSFAKIFNRLTFGLFEEFVSTQYFIRAVKKQAR